MNYFVIYSPFQFAINRENFQWVTPMLVYKYSIPSSVAKQMSIDEAWVSVERSCML